jgi:hypothetical protein
VAAAGVGVSIGGGGGVGSGFDFAHPSVIAANRTMAASNFMVFPSKRMPSRDLERDLAALCQHSIELGFRVLVAAGEKRRDDADHVVPLHAADATIMSFPGPTTTSTGQSDGSLFNTDPSELSAPIIALTLCHSGLGNCFLFVIATVLPDESTDFLPVHHQISGCGSPCNKPRLSAQGKSQPRRGDC